MKLYASFFSLIFLLMAGCASHRAASPYAAAVPISAAAQKQYQMDNLHKSGVQVIQVGDELRFILPDKRFFTKNTAVLQATSYPALSDIVALLNQQRNFGIQVVAYTIALDNFKPNASLARQQAQTLVDYFLQHGLSTRLITASAWQGLSARQKQEGTGRFSEDPPGLFSVEVRTRLMRPEDVQ
jgi:outer membrane protein OmpA-like peptidoglycan-associated protein